MGKLQEKLAQQIPAIRDDIAKLVKEHGDKVISQVTVAQAYGGMRDVLAFVCDTSVVKKEIGLVIRGIPIGELTEKLPEEIFYLLLTGELPDKEALKDLQEQWKERGKVPKYVFDVLKALPKDSHPMVMLSMAILSMEKESIFRKRYDAGMKKTEYWEPALEDAMNLLAKLPEIASFIYRYRFDKGNPIPPDPNLDWGANYAHMLGLPDPKGDFKKLMRLYMVLHSDHEGGNVSAFTCHTVGSALSDPYYAVSAGLNGLAGPLHGLANQECLAFVLDILKTYNGVPTEEQLRDYCKKTLDAGRVIPGYGHAVLRCPDPRFIAFLNFGKKYCPEDPPFRVVEMMFKVVPGVLIEQGKAKNPQPNVDAGSGALLYHFGMTEFSYYTVLFGVSRAMGMLSQLVINRALGTPITRPKTESTAWIKEFVKSAN